MKESRENHNVVVMDRNFFKSVRKTPIRARLLEVEHKVARICAQALSIVVYIKARQTLKHADPLHPSNVLNPKRRKKKHNETNEAEAGF